MRIELLTIDDFCSELACEAEAGRIFENVVRVRVDKTPEQLEAISHAVGVWGTALIRSEDGEWVLEFGQVAGSDSPGHPTAGSDVAAKWRAAIAVVAEKFSLTIRHGKIEVW